MNEEWLAQVIHHLRAIGNDTQQYEVKEAKGALPKSIVETLSAFSNAQGGFVILGISEKNGFVPVEGFDARKMQDALSSACEKLTPVVRPDIQVIPFEENWCFARASMRCIHAISPATSRRVECTTRPLSARETATGA